MTNNTMLEEFLEAAAFEIYISNKRVFKKPKKEDPSSMVIPISAPALVYGARPAIIPDASIHALEEHIEELEAGAFNETLACWEEELELIPSIAGIVGNRHSDPFIQDEIIEEVRRLANIYRRDGNNTLRPAEEYFLCHKMVLQAEEFVLRELDDYDMDLQVTGAYSADGETVMASVLVRYSDSDEEAWSSFCSRNLVESTYYKSWTDNIRKIVSGRLL